MKALKGLKFLADEALQGIAGGKNDKYKPPKYKHPKKPKKHNKVTEQTEL